MSSEASYIAQTIEPDEPPSKLQPVPSGRIGTTSPSGGSPHPLVILTPTDTPLNSNATPSDQEEGLTGILRQSSHPLVLLCLYAFRIAAVATYLLCGFFTENFVLSIVVVVVLLAMDFWNTRNVAGRRLVGLRYWNTVDDDGESYWVFESRDPSVRSNPVDSKMFWIAIYAFPALWFLILILSLIRFSLSFVPIVVLALVFNVTNAVGFTYADRDAKKRWASNVAAKGWNMGLGGIGGQIVGSVVKNSVGKAFGI